MPWTTQVAIQALRVVVFGTGKGTGLFVYNGTPAAGNGPVFSVVPPGINVDPYGNSVVDVVQMGSNSSGHLSVDQFGELIAWNTSGQLTMFLQPAKQAFLVYNPPAAAGRLAISLAAQAGTDNFGNQIQQGVSAYETLGADTVAVQLGQGSFAGTPAAGFFTHDQTSPANSDPMVGAVQANAAGCSVVLYSGKSLAGSTGAGIEAEDSTFSGVAGGQVVIVGGVCNVQGNLIVNGTLSVGGSTSTSTNGLPDGTISGTSGGASAGTAHTHGPGSFAVTNGQHSHTL